jgi:hypothetical protein
MFLPSCLGLKSSRKLTKVLKQNFTNRFEGRNTGLSDKINIHGYYRYSFPDKVYYTTDTFFQNVMFYEDGTFIINLGVSGYKNDQDYFTSVIKKGKEDVFYSGGSDWGVYSISEDTIKAQYVWYPYKFTPWYTGEVWYLIKDKNSIQLILFKSDINQPVAEAKLRHDSYVKSATVATFHPLNHIPPPYGWLKKEKFFWRSEDDWNRYMKENGK